MKVRFEQADPRTAGLLAIGQGAAVTVRDGVMRADGLVVQLAESRLPREFTRGTVLEQVDTGPGGTYARLDDADNKIATFVESVGARMPTPDEASLLQLTAGTPVVTVTRVAYRDDGVPLEMNDMTLPANRYELAYEWAADQRSARAGKRRHVAAIDWAAGEQRRRFGGSVIGGGGPLRRGRD